jgi:hypothetical protein
MFKAFVVGAALLLSTAASALKFSTQTLITQYASAGEGQDNGQAPAIGKKHIKELKQLIGVANQHGVKVVASDEFPELWGAYFETTHVIVLSTDLDIDGACATLAHELGHVFTYPLLKDKDGDVVAQGVSYVVSETLGIEVAGPTFAYYNSLAGRDYTLATLMRNAKTIDRVSEMILKEMPQVEVK